MKLAVLGAGQIVRDLVSIAHDVPDVQIAAIYALRDDVPEMQYLQAIGDIGGIYTTLEQCLAADVDTVYVAVPSPMHFQYAKAALLAGKNVICEKPITLHLNELYELRQLAADHDCLLLEAAPNQYLANYFQLQSDLHLIGQVKLVTANYSQQSTQYAEFRAGEVPPMFSAAAGGGALMALNIHNVHFVVGLLGAPRRVRYVANVARGIDTSGILLMDYPQTKVVSTAALDVSAPIMTVIEGTAGTITVHGPTNVLDRYTLAVAGQAPRVVDVKIHPHRMFQEFTWFAQAVKEHDRDFADQRFLHSETVAQVLAQGLNDAGVTLGATVTI